MWRIHWWYFCVTLFGAEDQIKINYLGFLKEDL